MALVRYRPWRSLATWPAFPEMRNRFDQVIEEMLGTEGAEGMGWSPATDIVEHDSELRLTAELPGMNRDDIRIEIGDGMLTIRGEKKAQQEEKTAHARLIERTYGAFERSFTLPRSVDADRIEAEFTEGVLTVHMPKTQKAAGRQVEISAK
jgi:HSP20 family protein